MSQWYRYNLGDPLLATPALDYLKIQFSDFCEKHDQAEELALFSCHESEGQLHCDIVIYFPPAAADLAAEFPVVSCQKPAKAGLDLFVGSESGWALID